MNPTPYNHGGTLIGLMYRPKRSPQYANWMDTMPARRRRHTALLWICIGLALFVFCTAVLLAVHPAALKG